MNTVSSPRLAASECEVRLPKARTALLLDHPFFGTLLFRLATKPLRSIKTMAIDGVSLYYSSNFVETLTAAELQGTLAHEVMHPALQHHSRRGNRDQKRWNMACDYAINPMLIEAGLTLPKDVLLNARFTGMSVGGAWRDDHPGQYSGCPLVVERRERIAPMGMQSIELASSTITCEVKSSYVDAPSD